MKKYSREEQRLLAIWAVKCSERVLPFFEKAYPRDKRPRKAIETCKKWIRTGKFRMDEIRGASLAAHRAAKRAIKNNRACFAAHAAGQAVATAHVPEHAYGAGYYSDKIALEYSEENVIKEFKWQDKNMPLELKERWYKWQSKRLPKKLRGLWKDYINKS